MPWEYIILGVSVHMGTMGVLWASGGGQKPQKTSKNDLKSKKIEKKNVRINNQGPFFGRFHGQVIDSGVRVHMGTLGLV